MPTDKKEALFDLITRIHGPIDRDTFNAIYGGAVHHHIHGEKVTVDGLREVVEQNSKRTYGPGQYPSNPF